jgi:hypothetical protein
MLCGGRDITLIELLAEIEVIRQNDELAALLRPKIDRAAGCGKTAVDRRMRALVWQRCDPDFANDAVLADLTDLAGAVLRLLAIKQPLQLNLMCWATARR